MYNTFNAFAAFLKVEMKHSDFVNVYVPFLFVSGVIRGEEELRLFRLDCNCSMSAKKGKKKRQNIVYSL